MNRFLEVISATIILTIGVSGCQATTALHPTEISQPIVEPTITLSPSLTSVPPTVVAPTDTPDIQRTLIPKIEQEKANPSPTPFLLKTKFSGACQDEYYEEYTKISPNGNWLAESCFSNGTMQVSNPDGTKIFVVDSKDYFSDPLFPELTGSVIPVYWTKDSHFIWRVSLNVTC